VNFAAQIVRQRGIRVRQGLVLAYQASQLLGQFYKTLFLPWILKNKWFSRPNLNGNQERQRQACRIPPIHRLSASS
jgi:hypothetical protein